MLQSLHVVWIHALCMQCSPHSRVRNTKMSCNSSRTRTWTTLYRLNNAFFFINAFINITLGCNANAGKCTGISQCLVNSSGLVFYGLENVADNQLRHELNYRHINHICIPCNWKCKWHCERNRCTEMRIRMGLTLHRRFYRPRLYETIAVLFWTSGAGIVTVM